MVAYLESLGISRFRLDSFCSFIRNSAAVSRPTQNKDNFHFYWKVFLPMARRLELKYP